MIAGGCTHRRSSQQKEEPKEEEEARHAPQRAKSSIAHLCAGAMGLGKSKGRTLSVTALHLAIEMTRGIYLVGLATSRPAAPLCSRSPVRARL